MTQQKYRQILERKVRILSSPTIPNEEQEESSATIQNPKLLNKANYLLAEILKSQSIPSGTAGY
jgi:hypothetical protein